MAQAQAKSSKLGAVLRVTSGNFLEMFDFFLFGFYATYISKTFFPAEQRIRLAHAHLRHLRRGLPDAAAGRHRAGRLHRPGRPPQGPHPHARADGPAARC